MNGKLFTGTFHIRASHFRFRPTTQMPRFTTLYHSWSSTWMTQPHHPSLDPTFIKTKPDILYWICSQSKSRFYSPTHDIMSVSCVTCWYYNNGVEVRLLQQIKAPFFLFLTSFLGSAIPPFTSATLELRRASSIHMAAEAAREFGREADRRAAKLADMDFPDRLMEI